MPVIPHLPPYTGPYKVGTADIEVPVAALESPAASTSPTLDAVSPIPTVRLRLFYPCAEPPKKTKTSVYWILEPQHEHLTAFAGFLGAGKNAAKAIAYLSSALRFTTIPALPCAPLLAPTTASKRWPVLVFSHGLGGSRNSYSQIAGSIASHGVVVAAPEHRDGSAPISFVAAPNDDGEAPGPVPYQSISHTRSRETEEARDHQLRIRLWELGLVYDVLLKADAGHEVPLLTGARKPSGAEAKWSLSAFRSTLDLHRPGSVTWAGHSFGAATVVQFLKSVCHPPPNPPPAGYKPLYVAHPDSSLSAQIGPRSVLALLDIWTPPLLSASTSWLHAQTLPCFTGSSPSAPAASAGASSHSSPVLSVLSEGFFKWRTNLLETKALLTRGISGGQFPRPHAFYTENSAHLSQSDFGLLFPWLTRVAFKAQEPERTLRLNVRAVLETMRGAGMVEVARTSAADREVVVGTEDAERGEERILHRDGGIRGWVALSLVEEGVPGEGMNEKTGVDAYPAEAVMEGQMKRDA